MKSRCKKLGSLRWRYYSRALWINDNDALNDDGLDRDILVTRVIPSFYTANLIEYVFTLGYLAENCIAPALHVFAGVVEKVIVLHVDEKLGSRRVGILGARHRNTSAIIL
jgi:hypothetical protein